MKKNYVITFITEFIVLASGILVYKLAANVLGKEGFSEYALSRRIIALIQPMLLMGLGIGIPRYIAYASSNPNHKKPDAYFVGGIFIIVPGVLTSTFILNLFKAKFAFLMFGSLNYSYLIFPINLMLIGLILHTLCYSYLRGKLLMIKANILTFINIGIIPLLAFLIGKDVKQVLTFGGLLLITVSVTFLVFILRRILIWQDSNIFSYTKELISYGLQRVLGDIGLAALLSIPAIITAHLYGVKEGGYIAFGISLLNMIGSVFAPIGLILLPQSSQFVAQKSLTLLRYYIGKILKISLGLTLGGLIIFEMFTPQIIEIYLGRTFSELILIARIIIVSSLAYVVYTIVRSVIDAYYVKAFNTQNILISLMVFLSLSGLVVLTRKDYIYLVLSFVIAVFILGVLSIWKTKQIFQKVN